MTNRENNDNRISITQFVIRSLLITLLIFSLFQTITFNLSLVEIASADSSWEQTTEADFRNGTMENITITSDGNLQLSLQTKYINDDFNDESKISYKKDLIVGLGDGQVKLATLNKTFGGSDSDYGCSIQPTSDGGYIIIGVTYSYGTGDRNAWLIKTDSLGNEQWNKTIGGNSSDEGQAVLQTSDGGYIITGRTFSYGAGGFDLWLIKTDSSGKEQWNKTFGGIYSEGGSSVQPTSDMGYIIAGTTSSYGASIGLNPNAWLIKTDSSGNEQWNRTFGGSSMDACWVVQQTSDVGYIIGGGTVPYGSNLYDAWLIKTDSSGNEKWNKTFGERVPGRGNSVQQTSDGGYIIAGSTNSNNSSNKDVWLIKTDSLGNNQWNKTYGGIDYDEGCAIQQTSDDGYIIVGTTKSYGNGDNDIWIIKINSLGNEQWNKTFGGSSIDRSWAVQLTSDGGYLVIGYTMSYGAGMRDVWLIKTDSEGILNPFGNGYLSSKNLLIGENAYTIDAFNYSSSIPINTSIKIQFSQDNLIWFDSSNQNDWDFLSNGDNFIDLSNLEWQGSNFYYKVFFNSDNINTPILQKINITYRQYYSLGTYTSQPFDSTFNTNWTTLNWKEIKPSNSGIKFQLRTADTQFNLSTNNFLGPDGALISNYTTSGQSIWLGHKGDQWIQYKAYLSTIVGNQTPMLEDVKITFNKIQVTNNGDNNPPVANAGPDQDAKIDYIVYFDASGSWDPNDDPLKYKWDFGDGVSTDWQDSNKASHKYTVSGNYTVTLTVSDNNLTASDTCVVRVSTKTGVGPKLDESPWPMFQGNVKHTGLSPYYTSSNIGELKWKFRVGEFSKNHYETSVVIGNDGTIYVGSTLTNQGYLYSIDPYGKLNWQLKLGEYVHASPGIGPDGTIYLSAGDYVNDYYYAINPDGSTKWKLKIDEYSTSPTIDSDGTIYYGSRDTLYVLDPNKVDSSSTSLNSSLKWKFEAENTIVTSPAISSDGTIYVNSQNNHIYAIYPNGTQKWKYTAKSKIESTPTIGPEGTIYFGSNDNFLYAINPDATLKWKFKTDLIIGTSPAIGSDGTIYFGSDKFYALNPDGTQKWNYPIRVDHSSPAIGADGTIYVGAMIPEENKKCCLVALNPDGTEKWRYYISEFFNDFLYSPAIGADGTIYVGSEYENLFAIGNVDYSADTDNDGMPDMWEIQYDLDPNDPSDAQLDPDGDSLKNLEEYLIDTDPTNKDTDSDGYSDDIDAYPNDPNRHKKETTQDYLFEIILIILVIFILIIIISLKLFIQRSKRQRLSKTDFDEEMLNTVRHKILHGETLQEMEYSRDEIEGMLDRRFKDGKISIHTYNLIKKEILCSDEAQLGQMNNSKLRGKE